MSARYRSSSTRWIHEEEHALPLPFRSFPRSRLDAFPVGTQPVNPPAIVRSSWSLIGSGSGDDERAFWNGIRAYKQSFDWMNRG